MEHTDQHEELLQRLLLEETSASEPDVGAQLASCATCRAEFERLRALDQRLGAAAEQEHADLALARSTAGAADEQRVRATLMSAVARRRKEGRRRFTIFALAAGLVLATGLALRALVNTEHGVKVPEVLLGGDIECDSPVGAWGDYDVFSWTYKLPYPGHFELRFYVLTDDGLRGDPVYTIDYVTESEWKPSAEQQRTLPARLYWEVQAFDDTSGMPVDSGFAKAWH